MPPPWLLQRIVLGLVVLVAVVQVILLASR
jgi:hypothetical protein